MAGPWEQYQDAQGGAVSPTGVGYIGPTESPKDGPWKQYASEFDPTAGMTGTEKFLAGTGKSFYDIGRGAGQLAGLVSREDVEESRRLDEPLMRSGAGRVGNIAGNIAAFAPAAMIPGANTAAGAALIGGAMGATQPVGADDSRLANVAIGAGLGAGGQQVGQRGGQFLTSRLNAQHAQLATQQGQNAERDATVRAAREAGYLIPPSSVNPTFKNQVLESISGKIATAQTAASKNQAVTEKLIRRAVGLADDAPITKEAMQGIRQTAYAAGYQPVTQAGAMPADAVFVKALDDVVSKYQGAARSFPGAASDDVSKLVEGYRVSQFDAGDAIKATQILRDRASSAYASGNKELGKASREVANALEDQIERNLSAAGQDGAEMLGAFRAARQLMAKTHTVENSVRAGSGNVTAASIARETQKGRPLTGELETVGRFANVFPRAAQAPQTVAGPAVHNLKSGLAAIMGGGGAAALGPVGVTAAAVPFVAPPLARAALFSRGAQAALTPSYQPNMLSRALPRVLDNEYANALAMLTGPAAYRSGE
jgi:hypothetical protein